MAHKNYNYILAENWGKGFIEANDRRNFEIREYPGNIYQVPAHNKKANAWINEVLGTIKTKDEAETIVNAEIQNYQTDWDNDNIDGETIEQKNTRIGERPMLETLEE
jgi:hypothetical protein